jgi:hypothetical protein
MVPAAAAPPELLHPAAPASCCRQGQTGACGSGSTLQRLCAPHHAATASHHPNCLGPVEVTKEGAGAGEDTEKSVAGTRFSVRV